MLKVMSGSTLVDVMKKALDTKKRREKARKRELEMRKAEGKTVKQEKFGMK